MILTTPEIFIVLFLFIPGCQSLPPFDLATVPGKILRQFQECSPSEGGLEIRNFQEGVRAGSVELDWKSFAPGDLRAEAVDPLGRQILGVRMAGPLIDFKGPQANSLPKMVTDDDGFLKVSDFRVGIRQDELACLLNFKIPLAWKSKISSYHNASGQSQLSIDEGDRRMVMTFFDDYVYKSERICTVFAWKSFWGVRTDHLTWCKEVRGGRKTSEIHDDKKTLIEWLDDESENS